MVFDRSAHLKYYWESVLNTTLPDDAEVWSKPEKESEIYEYIPESVGDFNR